MIEYLVWDGFVKAHNKNSHITNIILCAIQETLANNFFEGFQNVYVLSQCVEQGRVCGWILVYRWSTVSAKPAEASWFAFEVLTFMHLSHC